MHRQAAKAEEPEIVAKYVAKSSRPWFGEIALWNSKRRGATAVCVEPTKVVVVYSKDFFPSWGCCDA